MRKMKYSGVEWIGEIPEDWEVKKNKYILSNMYSGGTPTANKPELYSDEGTPFVSIGDMSETDYVCDTKKKLSDLGVKEKNLKILPAGTIIYSIYATIGAVSELKIQATISQALLALSINNQVIKSWYKYNLNAMRDYICFSANGNTQFNLNAEKVWNFSFVIPPTDTQRRIADFLDDKCGKIDRYIEKQQQIIDKLKEYKQAVITEAVTKGLDPDVPMKDSGIEWIGMIPEHWDVRRLRYLGSCVNGISKSGEFFGNGFPFVSYGDVYKNMELPSSVAGLVETTEDEREWYSVKEGDVFFTRTSETIEEVALTSTCMKTIENATFAGFLIRFRPNTNLLTKGFSKYYFRSDKHRLFFVKEMNLVTRASLSQELLKRLPVLLPTIDEQLTIAAYLEQKCSNIDEAINKKYSVIEKLIKYKKSLIYEAVTGKLEV